MPDPAGFAVPPLAGNSSSISTPTVKMNVSAPNSMVVHWLTLGGSGNTAETAYSVTANSPAGATTFGGSEAGGNYAGHALARSSGLTPGLKTFSFNNGLTDVICLTAEFLAAEIPATDCQLWSSRFPAADLADSAADFDHDGVSNDEERIWGLDPTSGTSVSPVVTVPGPAAGTFTYTRRRASLTGQSFDYESSSSLQTGEWFPFTPDGEEVQSAGDVETVTATLPAEILGANRLFVRVVAD